MIKVTIQFFILYSRCAKHISTCSHLLECQKYINECEASLIKLKSDLKKAYNELDIKKRMHNYLANKLKSRENDSKLVHNINPFVIQNERHFNRFILYDIPNVEFYCFNKHENCQYCNEWFEIEKKLRTIPIIRKNMAYLNLLISYQTNLNLICNLYKEIDLIDSFLMKRYDYLNRLKTRLCDFTLQYERTNVEEYNV